MPVEQVEPGQLVGEPDALGLYGEVVRTWSPTPTTRAYAVATGRGTVRVRWWPVGTSVEIVDA